MTILLYMFVGAILFTVWFVVDNFTFTQVVTKLPAVFFLFVLHWFLWPIMTVLEIRMLWKRSKKFEELMRSGNARADQIAQSSR